MLTILLAALLAGVRTGAVPISAGPATVPTVLHTIVFGPQPRADCSGVDMRTTYEIVRSCLFTIAACVYRAIHQNIPDPSLSFWGRLRIRMKITFYALMAPEMMIWWGMRQWFGAKMVVELVQIFEPRLKWTQVHGHFAQMGGFGRKDDKRVLYPETLIELLKEGRLDIDELQLTEKEIQDKSKGDILSKALVAFQTTWFVFECLARLQQRLPLVELEVVTLAFATLNVITYGLWWYKPLNILCPIYIQVLPGGSTPPTEGPVAGEQTGTSDQILTKGESKETKVGIMARVAAVIRKVAEFIKHDVRQRPWYKTLWMWFVVEPFVAITSPLKEILDDYATHDEATHVSTFYAMSNSSDGVIAVQELCSFIGVIFGAIHFIPWHSTFPTHAELVLWRTSAIVLVVLPFFLLLRGLFYHIWWNNYMKRRSVESPQTRWERLAALLRNVFQIISFFLGPIPYFLARICLLVLAFLTLHNLPLRAFTNTSWTSYIPHV